MDAATQKLIDHLGPQIRKPLDDFFRALLKIRPGVIQTQEAIRQREHKEWLKVKAEHPNMRGCGIHAIVNRIVPGSLFCRRLLSKMGV